MASQAGVGDIVKVFSAEYKKTPTRVKVGKPGATNSAPQISQIFDRFPCC
jgi:hypothetical protein